MSSSISISKRWLVIYLLTLGVSVGVGTVYTMFCEPETKFWVGAFRERRVELEKAPESPKLIFSGDSACSFGIDPVIFRDEMGMATYNLGGSRQMGMRIFMNEALNHAQKGDVIVLICNPYLLAAEADASSYPKAGGRMALALSEELKLGEFIDASRPGFNHLVSLGAKIALRMPMFRYRAEDHQAFGQVITSDRDHAAPTREPFEITERMRKVETVMRTWRDRCQERGVTLCYLLPVELTDPAQLDENRRKKGAFLDELEKQVPGVVMLRTPESGCSDDASLFADTLFHLTAEGAADFTRRLAPVMKKALD